MSFEGLNGDDEDEGHDDHINDMEMAGVDEAFVEERLKELMFRFDAVQIFVTRQEPDGRTMGFTIGKGNFYARWGVVNEWMSHGGVSEAPGTSIDDS